MNSCVKCGSPAKMACSICFDPYCGSSCQMRDWLAHKKICKPMPGLISMESLNCKIETPPNNQSSYERDVLEAPARAEIDRNRNEGASTSKAARQSEVEYPTSTKPTSLQVTKKSSKSSRFFLSEVEIIKIREGKDVSIVVTDTSFIRKYLISGFDSQNIARHTMPRNLKKLETYCSIEGSNKRGYDPQFKEMCLAVFEEDGKWYRAFMMEANPRDGLYILEFVDYGNISKVPRYNIMPITKDFMFPICINLCRIVNVRERDLPGLEEYIEHNKVIKGDVRFNQEADVYEVTVSFSGERALK